MRSPVKSRFKWIQAIAYLPCLMLLMPAARLHAAPKPPPLKASLIAEDRALVPGRESVIGLHLVMEKGWHVYWINPGDSGQAPKVDWGTMPKGIQAGPIQWPAPERIPLGPLVNFGYGDEVLLPIPLIVAQDAPVGQTVKLEGTAKFLVCREICIPGESKVELSLPVEAAGPGTTDVSNPDNHALFTKYRAMLPKSQPSDWAPEFRLDQDRLVLRFRAPASGGTPIFFPLETLQADNAAPQIAHHDGDFWEVSVKKAEDLATPPLSLRGVVELSGGEAYTVEARLVAEAAGRKIPLMILFAFLGGLILNLMPCVFPVLSIKVLSFINQSHEEKAQMRVHGLVYTLGILVSFWSLVTVLLALRSGGEQLGWGFQLQSPGFLAFLCVLLFLFGLSLVGVFDVGSSLMSTGSGLASRGGYAGSFFTGVLATVVATPCSAPFMGSAVGFALSQSAIVAFAIFTSLALGLAAPYVLISFIPAVGRFLPRPGRWMETLKQFMAFLIFGTVIWLVWVFGLQCGMGSVARLLTALLFVGLAGWMLGRWPGRKAFAIGSIAVLAFSLYVGLSGAHPGEGMAMADDHSDGLPWEKFDPQKVKDLVAQGKPVFVDFTASWCLTCQANEAVVFHSDEVKQKFKSLGITMMKADWTSHDAVITETLASFGRSVVPLYVLYGALPGGAPDILPELINASIVLKELDKVKM